MHDEPDVPRGVTVRVETEPLAPPARAPARASVTCFRCGESGHYRAECHTFKVKLCPRFEHEGCADPHCSYAHGAAELRQPWISRCVRVVRAAGGGLVVVGCGRVGHTYRHCRARCGA